VSLPPGARDARPVGGGDINEAFRAVLHDGTDAFVKTRADAAPGEYAAEAAGLRWLAEPGALRTPRVLEVDDGYLALQWIEPGRLDADGEQELGRGLAATHTAQAPRFGRFTEGSGGERDGDGGGTGGSDGDVGGNGDGDDDEDFAGFGSLRLSNAPTMEWPTFYAERRLRQLARLARDGDVLSAAGVQAIERVCERMAQLTGAPEAPARLHGDLWQGNVLADSHGRPWLIDPSAYGGHREVDLAMLALFGSPSPIVLASYGEVAPLADGWQERVGLYQLLPLLVHALLFGGSYRAAAEDMARRYA
jgi:fructosamine-3-kinase